MSILHRFFLLFTLSFSTLAGAAHITDKLVVGLYAEPKAEGTPLRLVSSGTPLEVVSRKGAFSEVRLADDTRGWVETTYVTEEKPAKAMLLETQAKLRQMGMELAGLREKAAADDGNDAAMEPAAAPPTAREAQLRQSLQQAEQRVAELEQTLAEVPRQHAAQAELDELRARTAEALRLLADAQGVQLGESAAGTPPPGVVQRYRPWIVGAVALAIGFAAGIGFIDYRIRKRYGGFRI